MPLSDIVQYVRGAKLEHEDGGKKCIVRFGKASIVCETFADPVKVEFIHADSKPHATIYAISAELPLLARWFAALLLQSNAPNNTSVLMAAPGDVVKVAGPKMKLPLYTAAALLLALDEQRETQRAETEEMRANARFLDDYLTSKKS